MTDFSDCRIAKCPYCKTPFATEEGMLCDCYEIMMETQREMEEEWRRWEDENG